MREHCFRRLTILGFELLDSIITVMRKQTLWMVYFSSTPVWMRDK